MTPGEVLTSLLSLRRGGFTAIAVGFFAYKKAAAEGRREPMKPGELSTPGPLPGSHDIELLANSVSALTASVCRLGLLYEFHNVEQADKHEDFREWSERRLLQAEIAVLRAAHEAR